MKVETILANKGHDVITVTGRQTIADVCRILADKRIGAVVVGDGDGRITGIVTERDIVRVLAADGAAALARSVAEVMTREVVTVGANDTINDVSERMTRGRFRHIPVTDGTRLIGIISIGDVVKHRIESIEAEASAMRDYIATA